VNAVDADMNSIEHAYARFCESRFPLPSEQQVATLEQRMAFHSRRIRQFVLAYKRRLVQ